jgi:hypothetical protein
VMAGYFPCGHKFFELFSHKTMSTFVGS